jgi:integrase
MSPKVATRNGPRNGNGAQSVSRFLKIKGAKSKATARAYATSVKQFFWFLEGEPIRRAVKDRSANDAEMITSLDARAVAYLDEVATGERSAADDVIDFVVQMGYEGYSPSTVHNARAAVIGFLELNNIELTRGQEKNIKGACPKPGVVAEEIDLSLDMLRKIVPHLEPHHCAVTLVMLSSGARAGEVLKLRIADLDLDAEPARVHFRRGTTKTKKGRISFLTVEAVDTLRAWMAIRNEYILTAAAKMAGLVNTGFAPAKRTEDDRLFPFEASSFYRGFNRAVEKAGFFERCEETGRSKIRAHGLRKFFRTYFGMAAGPDVAEKLMGHAGYLAGAYVRLTEEDLARAYEENCHVLMIARGASLDLRRRIAEVEGENMTLRQDLAAIKADLIEVQVLRTMLANRNILNGSG